MPFRTVRRGRNTATAIAWPVGLPLFDKHRLESDDVQSLFGYQLLELAVLFFQLTKPLCFAPLPAHRTSPSAVERLVANPMLATQLHCLQARL